jgi:hypothetical protein
MDRVSPSVNILQRSVRSSIGDCIAELHGIIRKTDKTPKILKVNANPEIGSNEGNESS